MITAGGNSMHLSERQQGIVELLKKQSPLTTDSMVEAFQVSRSVLQSDLAMLLAWGVLDQEPRQGYCICDSFNDKNAVRERVKHLRVRDFMRSPVSVDEDCSIHEALVALFTYDVANMIIVGKSRDLRGVVSRKDFLRASLGKIDYQQVPVNVIMTRMPNIIWALPDDRVVDVAAKLIKHQIDTIPIVEVYIEADGNEAYHVIGCFTRTIILFYGRS
jgi:predicted transcriptional regulator